MRALSRDAAYGLGNERVAVCGDWHGNIGWVRTLARAMPRLAPDVSTVLQLGDWWMDPKGARGGRGLPRPRPVRQKVPAGVAAVTGDLLAPETLPAAVQGVSAVIHLAAVLRTPDPEQITRVNVEGTENLIAAIRDHAPGARLIMASTGLIYDAEMARPAREDDPANPSMPYPASKVAAERAVRESGLTWSILRFAFVYGDGDGHLQSAPGLLGSWGWHPAAMLSLIHHRDIATAMMLALDGAMDNHIVNLTDESPASVYEIGGLVGADYNGSATPLENPWNGRLDGTLARELGFTPLVRTIYQAAAEAAL